MWDFITIVHRKAAKDYCCEECKVAISKGDRHVYTAGKCEGEMLSYRLCEYCNRLARLIAASSAMRRAGR